MQHRLLLPLAAVLISQSAAVNGQSFESIELEGSCNYAGGVLSGTATTFGSVDEAGDIIDQTVEASGLSRNFLIEAASVPNAAAAIEGTERYILYNPDFIHTVRQTTGTEWAAISIMAHEVAHHLNGHTLRNDGSRPPTELE